MRLTQAVRSRIAEDLMKGKFTEREKAVEQDYINWIEDMYRAGLGKHYDMIQNADPGLFRIKSDIRIRIGSEDEYVYFKDDSGERTYKKFPQDHYQFFQFGARSEIAKRWTAIERERDAIRSEAKALRTSIWALLNSATTIKKLIEIWPEVKPIAEKYDKVMSTAVMPVRTINRLNKDLGLAE